MATTPRRNCRLARPSPEPSVPLGKEVSIGDESQDPAGITEPLRKLAENGNIARHRRSDQPERGVVPPPAQKLQEGDGITVRGDEGSLATRTRRSLAGGQSPGSRQASLLDGTKSLAGHVVGEHTGQEQRQVAEPTQHAGPLSLGNNLEQASHADGVQLGEPLPAEAASGCHRHGSTRHVRIRRQQLSQEEPAPRGGTRIRAGRGTSKTGVLLLIPIHSDTYVADSRSNAAAMHGDSKRQER